MKRAPKTIFTLGILLMLSSSYAQTGAKQPVKRTTPAIGHAVAVELKNLSEKSVTIFAGRRDELKNPKAKQKVYGGLSTNTLYVSVNEVVCIISPQEKPGSCANVKTGTTKMEVNAAGTVITAK